MDTDYFEQGLRVLFGLAVAVAAICCGIWTLTHFLEQRRRERAEERRRLEKEQGRIRYEAREKARKEQEARDGEERRRQYEQRCEENRRAEERERIKEERRREEQRIADCKRRAAKCVAETRDTLIKLRDALQSAATALDSAEIQYKDNKYHPFWSAAFASFDELGKADEHLARITDLKSEYYTIATEAPGLLPPFLDLAGIEQIDDIFRSIRPRLSELVYEAHGDATYAEAYGAQMLAKTIEGGLEDLANRLNKIESAIHRNTTILSARLSTVGSELSGIRYEIRTGNEIQLQAHSSLVDNMARGINHATGHADENALAAQRQARTTISELRNIKRRL